MVTSILKLSVLGSSIIWAGINDFSQASELGESFQLAQQNTILSNNSPDLSTPQNSNFWTQKDFLNIQDSHFGSTPVYPGLFFMVGNEVGDMVFQELANQSQESNRTPKYYLSYYPEKKGWNPTVAFEQSDYFCQFSKNYRYSLLTENYNGKMPENYWAWRALNIPDYSWLQAGLNFYGKTNQRGSEMYHSDFLETAIRSGFFWLPNRISGEERAYRMHQITVNQSLLNDLKYSLALRLGEQLRWNTDDKNSQRDFYSLDLRIAKYYKFIPILPDFLIGANTRFLSGLEYEYDRINGYAYLKTTRLLNASPLIEWLKNEDTPTNSQGSGIMASKDYLQYQLGVPFDYTSRLSGRIVLSGGYGEHPFAEKRARIIQSHHRDTLFNPIPNNQHWQEVELTPLVYNIPLSNKDQPGKSIDAINLYSGFWTRHKPKHFATDSAWQYKGRWHRTGQWQYTETWNKGMELGLLIHKSLPWKGELELFGNWTPSLIDSNSLDIVPPNWKLYGSLQFILPSNLFLRSKLHWRSKYVVKNWGKDFEVDEGPQLDLEISQRFLNNKLVIFATLNNLFAYESKWHPNGGEHRFNMDFGLNYHFD